MGGTLFLCWRAPCVPELKVSSFLWRGPRVAATGIEIFHAFRGRHCTKRDALMHVLLDPAGVGMSARRHSERRHADVGMLSLLSGGSSGLRVSAGEKGC